METYYGIQWGENNFVMLDDPSGGYPCKVNNLRYAKKWSSYKECKKYFDMFTSDTYRHNEKWSIIKIELKNKGEVNAI